MKLQILKIAKLSALILTASLAATLPVKSMAHDSGYINAEILVNLLPLLNTHHIHEYQRSNYYPHKVMRHHRHHHPRHSHQRYVRDHQPRRIVRSYNDYSDNKIIRKHFK
jgi:hypothetical protein